MVASNHRPVVFSHLVSVRSCQDHASMIRDIASSHQRDSVHNLLVPMVDMMSFHVPVPHPLDRQILVVKVSSVDVLRPLAHAFNALFQGMSARQFNQSREQPQRPALLLLLHVAQRSVAGTLDATRVAC